MNKMRLENFKKTATILESLSRVVLLVPISLLLVLYIFAIPLGLELVLFGNLSTMYSPSSTVSVAFFGVHILVSLGITFTALVFVYILCFALAWRQRTSFHKVIDRFFSKRFSLHLKNFLFAMPLLSSLTYVVVDSLHFLQESHGIPIGEPPLPKDPLLAFLELSISPVTEEIIFRIFPIGTFLVAYLLALARTRKPSIRWKERLKLSVLTLVSPEDAKKMLGLKTVDDSGFWKGINFDEWAMILFTSALFGFSHYFPPSTWNVGKITSTFIQGLVMGLSYLIYGIQAPILIHWFFNYYLYTYGLAAIVHPSLIILGFLNEKLTSILGILGLLTITSLGGRELVRNTLSSLRTVLHSAQKVRNSFAAKGDRLLLSIRQLNFVSFKSLIFDLAALILTLTILVMRLAIVNFPQPEAGGRYYETGFVFDESYYVKAARKLLNGEASNNEHPPLAKALIMLGMILFGDKPLGWRISSIIASSISVALVYVLALFLSKNKAVSFSAALLFAADIMFFNIGQIGMLDASSMMFVLVASILLLKRRYDFSGLFFGLASLCKLSSIFAMGIVFFPLLTRLAEGKKPLVRSLREWVPFAGRIFLIGFITLLTGLWIYDAGYKVFNGNPLDHLNFMFVYNNSLKYENPGDVILPLQWINPLNPFSPIPYHVTSVREISNGGIVREYHPIAYYGLYTPLWWSSWAIVPISLAKTIRKVHKSDGKEGIDPFFLSWILTSFFPYVVFAYFVQRWVYPFYFCMTLPGVYLGLSYYLGYSRLSKILLILLISTQLLWFFVWFPVKPKGVIDFLSLLGLPT